MNSGKDHRKQQEAAFFYAEEERKADERRRSSGAKTLFWAIVLAGLLGAMHHIWTVLMVRLDAMWPF